jgi:hypothetical protein
LWGLGKGRFSGGWDAGAEVELIFSVLPDFDLVEVTRRNRLSLKNRRFSARDIGRNPVFGLDVGSGLFWWGDRAIVLFQIEFLE